MSLPEYSKPPSYEDWESSVPTDSYKSVSISAPDTVPDSQSDELESSVTDTVQSDELKSSVAVTEPNSQPDESGSSVADTLHSYDELKSSVADTLPNSNKSVPVIVPDSQSYVPESLEPLIKQLNNVKTIKKLVEKSNLQLDNTILKDFLMTKLIDDLNNLNLTEVEFQRIKTDYEKTLNVHLDGIINKLVADEIRNIKRYLSKQIIENDGSVNNEVDLVFTKIKSRLVEKDFVQLKNTFIRDINAQRDRVPPKKFKKELFPRLFFYLFSFLLVVLGLMDITSSFIATNCLSTNKKYGHIDSYKKYAMLSSIAYGIIAVVCGFIMFIITFFS